MFRSTISASDTSSRCLTSARRLFPCVTSNTRFPERTTGSMRSCQDVKTRAKVSFKLSVAGISSGLSFL